MIVENIIETSRLTRRFAALCAVDALDLRVSAGSVYAFLGPNGAGKTVTIRMLLGLLHPSAGEVRLFGRPLAVSRRELLRRIGALVETPALYPHLTGRENLLVTCRMLDLPPAHIQRALAIVNLEQDSNRLVRQYSLGMRQRLGLALALLNLPALLILDEPTNGLDPAGILEIRELIRRLPREHGITVFLSSHLLNEVEQLADRVGILNQGRLLFEGSLSELQAGRAHTLTISVNGALEAARLLSAAGWKAHVAGSGALRVEVGGSADAAAVNAALVRAGWQVYHLSIEQPSLEELFLSLTGAAPSTPAAAPALAPAFVPVREVLR